MHNSWASGVDLFGWAMRSVSNGRFRLGAESRQASRRPGEVALLNGDQRERKLLYDERVFEFEPMFWLVSLPSAV